MLEQIVWFFHHVIVPLLLIGGLIFIHELGHFLLAKWCGVGVLRFSIGFGPVLWKRIYGETQYQIALIPLGGYVRMVGDMPDMITGEQATDDAVRQDGEVDDSQLEQDLKGLTEAQAKKVKEVIADKSKWFINKNFFQKSAIVIAGPLFNLVFSLSAIFWIVLNYGAMDVDLNPVIGKVAKFSVAEKSGILEGDLIKTINTRPISKWEELAEAIHGSNGQALSLEIERKTASGEIEKKQITVQPMLKQSRQFTGDYIKSYFIGIEPRYFKVHGGVVFSLNEATNWIISSSKLSYLGIWMLISGKGSTDDIRGPIFIIKQTGETSKEGFEDLLRFAAVISLALALLNLLPIPVLDGGHLLFFIIEAIFGQLSVRMREYAQNAGMILILWLMIIALKNDLTIDDSKIELPGVKWAESDTTNQPPVENIAPSK